MVEAPVSIDELEARYPGHRALAAVSLALAPGEACALVGENGSGKTTLLRILAGLMPPAGGRVRVADAPPGSRAARRAVGFMPDSAPVYGRLRVAEDLDHFARAHGVPARGARIEAALRRVWLTERAQQPCGELSRGLRQRLLLARALLHGPRVLLLDEPSSGLDPHGRVVLRGLLRELAGDATTILVSSHVLSELETFCDTAALLENGRLARHETIAREQAPEGIRMRLVLREPCEAVAEMLAADERITGLDTDEAATRYAFAFAGSDKQLDALLAGILERGGRVAEWTPARRGLEAMVLENQGGDG